MGSKLPTDGESQSQSLGVEGRQLRSRLVEVCNLCQKPLPTTAAKSTASHIHCTCVTPPNTTTAAAASAFSSSMSPRKKKITEPVEMGESSKRQLFKDPVFKSSQQLVPAYAAASTSASATAAAIQPVAGREIPSEEENVAATSATSSRKSESKSRHVCSVCSKCFNTPGKLNQHMFSHTGEKPFVCDHCSKAFSSKFKLVRHILIHSDTRQYRCTVCERTFHRKDHLKNHSKVHSPVKRRFKCDRSDCNKEYSSVLSYRKHMAVHSAEEGNLECKICGKKFDSKEETLLHLKVHAGSRSLKTPADRKYHCDQCERSFFTGKDVRRHLVVHTGRRDFLCQYCPQRFGRKDHLTRHIKKSHSTSSKKAKTRRTAVAATVTVTTVATTTVTVTVTGTATATATATATSDTSEMESVVSSKSVGHIISEWLQKGYIRTKEEEEEEEGDLYKMQGFDSPVDVTKLESSPDILPIVTMDDKGSIPSKVEDTVGMYGMPAMLDPANIPFTKYEPYPFEPFPYGQPTQSQMPGPSTSHTIVSQIMYQQQQQQQQQQPPPQQQQQPPPPPYPAENVEVKAEQDYAAQTDTSTLDLVLPPITNISPTMGSCMLSNADLQTLLMPTSSAGVSGVASIDEGETSSNGSRIADQLLNLLPSSNELLESLLSSATDENNSAPLPGFSQAFHQPP